MTPGALLLCMGGGSIEFVLGRIGATDGPADDPRDDGQHYQNYHENYLTHSLVGSLQAEDAHRGKQGRGQVAEEEIEDLVNNHSIEEFPDVIIPGIND